MLRWLAAATLCVLFGFGACAPRLDPQDSCNFSQNSEKQRVSWKGHLPIPIYLHSSVPIQYRQAILDAMNTWAEELQQPVFTLAGVSNGSLSAAGQDGYSVIYWMDNWPNEYEQARTTIYWVGSEIREADIRINGDLSMSGGEELIPGYVDMESLMLHELGHVLGLAHNHDFSSIMVETLATATARRELSNTDRQSLACEY